MTHESRQADGLNRGEAAKIARHRSIALIGLGAALLWLAGAASLVSTAPSAAEQVPAPVAAAATVPHAPDAIARDVACVGLVVDDMDRSIAFYRDVLSFKTASDIEVTGEQQERLQGVFGLRMRIVTMQLGDERIELTEYLVPKGRPYPADSRSNDAWFQHIAIITSDMDRAYAWLREHKVRHASTSPQRLPDWNKDAGGIRAFYFHDPDGHVLEILQFPPDKGKSEWHRPHGTERSGGDELFLGIDHTAIVVSDTDQSLGFYRDVLGMGIAGASENYGVEQEHLNNVFGARLRITSLRPRSEHGPSIEFLEYLSPVDGRPYPSDARSNDLASWQTMIVTDDIEQAVAALRAQRIDWVSSGVADMSDAPAALGFRAAAIVRDPDGHAIRLIQR